MKPNNDPRAIIQGCEIPSEGYCDQPFVVVNEDDSWTAVMTTASGEEGESSQHVIAIRSTDKGKTWSDPVDIEPASGPEASWALPFKTPYGRIFVFYTYNEQNIREVIADTDYAKTRVDTLGVFAYRYSDDGGTSWSKDRYKIPMRRMQIDLDNPYHGDILFFWGVGKPIIHNHAMYLGYSKVGWFGESFITKSQGAIIRSENILTEKDPDAITWEILPEGKDGLKAPKGPISEETSVAGLSDGSLVATYRTVDGFSCLSYSRDAGKTWTQPAYMEYHPGGKKVKNPRAANFIWKTQAGTFLYWFHNNGGKNYDSRNPAWLTVGIEKEGYIHWAQPEILLYDDELGNRMSYPDLIEDKTGFYITETQKTVARVHQIDEDLLQGLFRQHTHKSIAEEGLTARMDEKTIQIARSISIPVIPNLIDREGFSMDFWVRIHAFQPGEMIFDSRDEAGRGIVLSISDRKTLQLQLAGTLYAEPGGTISGSGITYALWDTDPGVLTENTDHHVGIFVDGGPKIIGFVVDGVLCDGGESRTYGWSRFHPNLNNVNGAEVASLSTDWHGQLLQFRIYNRCVRVSELVGNYQAGILN